MLRLIAKACMFVGALWAAVLPLSARPVKKSTPPMLAVGKRMSSESIYSNRRLALLIEKPLFLGSRVGTLKSGIACVASGPLFGSDFLQVQDVDFLLRREMHSAGVIMIDGASKPMVGQIGLTISLEKIAAQLCSPSVGLFGRGEATTGKVTFTFLIRQRVGLQPELPVRAMDIIVPTAVYGPKMRQEEYFPKAINILTGWLLAEWDWDDKRKSAKTSTFP